MKRDNRHFVFQAGRREYHESQGRGRMMSFLKIFRFERVMIRNMMRRNLRDEPRWAEQEKADRVKMFGDRIRIELQ